eukprot:7391794-Prymnesium_polylepis.4
MEQLAHLLALDAVDAPPQRRAGVAAVLALLRLVDDIVDQAIEAPGVRSRIRPPDGIGIVAPPRLDASRVHGELPPPLLLREVPHQSLEANHDVSKVVEDGRHHIRKRREYAVVVALLFAARQGRALRLPKRLQYHSALVMHDVRDARRVEDECVAKELHDRAPNDRAGSVDTAGVRRREVRDHERQAAQVVVAALGSRVCRAAVREHEFQKRGEYALGDVLPVLLLSSPAIAPIRKQRLRTEHLPQTAAIGTRTDQRVEHPRLLSF